MPGSQPRIVRIILSQKGPRIPTRKKTAKGGKKMATINSTMVTRTPIDKGRKVWANFGRKIVKPCVWRRWKLEISRKEVSNKNVTTFFARSPSTAWHQIMVHTRTLNKSSGSLNTSPRKNGPPWQNDSNKYIDVMILVFVSVVVLWWELERPLFWRVFWSHSTVTCQTFSIVLLSRC